jgi:SagB-type dehydrogenase family enzyme
MLAKVVSSAGRNLNPAQALEVTLAYHERTKHQPGRFARAPGYMDWATQPDAFRRFDGSPLIDLALTSTDDGGGYAAIAAGDRPSPETLDATLIARLFRDSLGLSAWKESGASRWALRVNPSSGNLHPTEGYLIAGAIPGLSSDAGVYHYAPEIHALERRRMLSSDSWRELSARLPPHSILIALTSIHWREAWKYGERAFRYCQHDAGHAIAALSYAAAAVGYRVSLLGHATDEEVEMLVGVHHQDGIEAEKGICLLAVHPATCALSNTPQQSAVLSPRLRSHLADNAAQGAPNQLSRKHHHWKVIDDVADATGKSRAASTLLFSDGDLPEFGLGPTTSKPMRSLVHQRRSAVAMDGTTHIDRATFMRIVTAALKRDAPPFDALPWSPRIHLALFVHRVRDLDPGLYLLVRDRTRAAALRSALDATFAWSEVDSESDLPLYVLQRGECQKLAGAISCDQYGIASESVFAAAMLSDYIDSLDIHGPWFYRALYWEAGLIGQTLYLEAEAAGIRATGIGCYFDDATHEVLGLRDRRFQVLYHFTMGGAVDDQRLRTHPPYAHLNR